MAITTIKLNRKTKYALKEFRYENESYDIAIKRLISKIKTKNLKNDLIEFYKNTNKESLEVLKEWEKTSKELD